SLGNSEKQELQREKWERKNLPSRSLSRRSISKERWVETLVVADTKMVEYHGSENVESYILTIMNMHDGKENDCEPVGRHPYIMSQQIQYDPTPLTWSKCSKEYITRFLDRGRGFCLDDIPKKKGLKSNVIAPGVIYDVHHQCQLQYGPNATFCQEVENVCQTLWCSVKGFCRSKLDAAADGTRCGEKKVMCRLPEEERPKFGGKYCTGERKRYRLCNIHPCRSDTPTFRQMQCSEFDTVPYKNEFYRWFPVFNA
ncbi:hypothetical protein A6R68_19866, partial [Neotoma lepida]